MSLSIRIFATLSALILIQGNLFADQWVGHDKVAHFAAGLAVSSATFALLEGYRPGMSPLGKSGISFGSAIGVSLLKEALDLVFNTGEPSYKDLTWGIVGGILGSALILGFDVLLLHSGSR